MVPNIKKELADLLRSAAQLTIPEKEFWDRFGALVDRNQDPIGAMAYETATHYWGNFHARNLLLIPVKPDRYQVQQGQEELNLIADGLEQGWSPSELEQKLNDISCSSPPRPEAAGKVANYFCALRFLFVR